MDAADLRVRNATYAQFVAAGRAPTAADVAAHLGESEDDVTAAWRRLQDAHALVLNADGTSIRMANPFSAVPTPHRVHAAGRWWYGNCAWDAFGICAALHTDGTVVTTCPDCGDELTVRLEDRQPDDPTLVFHCLVPAAQWWENIGFT